jgi:23S rRNA U2552 (ribose-2'-O)-methylase RlmE/FtsJ
MSKTNYMPICIDISMEDKSTDIFSTKKSISFSGSQDFPLSKYGFQHFIHSIKNDTEKLKQFENKKKVYQVINPFERYIFDYNKSIGDISIDYFDLKSKPNILSRGFYKLWEMILMQDLIDINQDNFISTHLAEGPGSFIQATMFYRDMFSKKSKQDKYIAITVHPEDVGGHVPEVEQKFIDYYAKEKPVRFIMHKTTNKKNMNQSGGVLDNGDLTNPKTLYNFCGGANPDATIKDKVDFITADGGFEWVNENIQEQEYFRLLFSQIVTAINIQKKGGHFVCKFFETFTRTSMKFLEILRSLYKNVYLIKPLTSRPSNSEKYAVCKDFKYSDKDKKLTDIINIMNELHAKIHQSNKFNIVDLFKEFNFDNNFISKMIQINRVITNNQFKAIGQILTFVDSQNYFGDVYKEKREEQIKAAEYWTKLFFMEDKDYKKNKTEIQEIMNKIIKNNSDRANELQKYLVF